MAQGSDGTAPAHPPCRTAPSPRAWWISCCRCMTSPRAWFAYVRALAPSDGRRSRREARRCGRHRNWPICSRPICEMLRAQVGHDFSGYKRARPSCAGCSAACRCCSWTARRTTWNGCGRTRRRSTALFQDLLISVTSFFRDPDAFEALGEQVVCRSCSKAAARRRQRPGLGARLRHRRGGLFHRHAAARAHGRAAAPPRRCRSSPPTSTSAALGRRPGRPLPARRCRRRLAGAAARASSPPMAAASGDARNCATSASSPPHSLIRDPPFSRHRPDLLPQPADLSGRRGAARGSPAFHYALRPGGCLFLGTSESDRPASAISSRRSTGRTASSAAADAWPPARPPAALVAGDTPHAARAGRMAPAGGRPPARPLRQAGGSDGCWSASRRPMSW